MKLNLEQTYSLDDVALKPAEFSTIISRVNVSTEQHIGQNKFKLPIISSNMISVYSPDLSNQILDYGSQSIVHRFCSIDENIKLFVDGWFGNNKPWVSIGSAVEELERATALVGLGAETLVLDLAMGNSINAVEQFKRLREEFPNQDIIVSDFCHRQQLDAFVNHAGSSPTAFTIGQGIGSVCETRIRTGIGYASFSAIMDCTYDDKYHVILNGAVKDTGDFCKALAAGCSAVIVGRLFAGCVESGALKFQNHAVYSGSASYDSYLRQNKVSSFRVEEGASYEIPITGTVKNMLDRFNGGLRSSMSYLNATDLHEYRNNAEFVLLTNNGTIEAKAYGKK